MKKPKNMTLFVIGILFIIAGIVLFIILYTDYAKIENLKANGVHTTATITDSHEYHRARTGYSYRFDYTFIDASDLLNPTVHKGSTKQAFHDDDANMYNSEQIIRIVYDPNTFVSIEECYNNSPFVVVFFTGLALLISVFFLGGAYIPNKKVFGTIRINGKDEQISKTFTSVVIFAVAIFYLLISLLVFVAPIIEKNNYYNNLVKEGTKATATVTDSTFYEVRDGIPYYILDYYFNDANSNVHKGYTTPNYTKEEVQEIESTNQIEIVYDTKTFKSVEVGFDSTIHLIKEAYITIIIGAVGSLIAGIYMAIQLKNNKKRKETSAIDNNGNNDIYKYEGKF